MAIPRGTQRRQKSAGAWAESLEAAGEQADGPDAGAGRWNGRDHAAYGRRSSPRTAQHHANGHDTSDHRTVWTAGARRRDSRRSTGHRFGRGAARGNVPATGPRNGPLPRHENAPAAWCRHESPGQNGADPGMAQHAPGDRSVARRPARAGSDACPGRPGDPGRHGAAGDGWRLGQALACAGQMNTSSAALGADSLRSDIET